MPRGVYLRPAKKVEQASHVKPLPFVESVLAERRKKYGKFSDHAQIAQSLKADMHVCFNWHNLSPDMREALDMIQHKIARILNGDPTYKDSWVDIEGYAHLRKVVLT